MIQYIFDLKDKDELITDHASYNGAISGARTD